MPLREIIITGASGFLGQTLVDAARSGYADARVIPVRSPRKGGIDLTKPDSVDKLREKVHLDNSRKSVLIHAAAVTNWEEPIGLAANASMAANLVKWVREAEIDFSVLVSSVNVSHPQRDGDGNISFYGMGKWAAEGAWRGFLGSEDASIVRLAGVWGWQRSPSLFWNRLLLAAVGFGKAERLTIERRESRRNYISAREASECLLQVAEQRITGTLVAAGQEGVSLERFVKAVQSLHGSQLKVKWQDDGREDEELYDPSEELLPYLHSFEQELDRLWKNKPDWIDG
jgi:nucleoside-diphosphate-sugar epimerase